MLETSWTELQQARHIPADDSSKAYKSPGRTTGSFIYSVDDSPNRTSGTYMMQSSGRPGSGRRKSSFSTPFQSSHYPASHGSGQPEWQEYQLSPSMSFSSKPALPPNHLPALRDRSFALGDSFLMEGAPFNGHTSPDSAMAVLRTHDLRTITVEDALGISRDIPDEWIEALKQLVGHHLKTQLRM